MKFFCEEVEDLSVLSRKTKKVIAKFDKGVFVTK
ncbi:unnamed protein product, partial [marine sediment metagenome]